MREAQRCRQVEGPRLESRCGARAAEAPHQTRDDGRRAVVGLVRDDESSQIRRPVREERVIEVAREERVACGAEVGRARRRRDRASANLGRAGAVSAEFCGVGKRVPRGRVAAALAVVGDDYRTETGEDLRLVGPDSKFAGISLSCSGAPPRAQRRRVSTFGRRAGEGVEAAGRRTVETTQVVLPQALRRPGRGDHESCETRQPRHARALVAAARRRRGRGGQPLSASKGQRPRAHHIDARAQSDGSAASATQSLPQYAFELAAELH